MSVLYQYNIRNCEMYTPGLHSSLIYESGAGKNVPLRETQTATKQPSTEKRKMKFLPRRLSEFEKEIEEAKNEPLDLRPDDMLKTLPDDLLEKSLNLSEENQSISEKETLAIIEEEEEETAQGKRQPVRFAVPLSTPKHYSTPLKRVLRESAGRSVFENKENRVLASVPIISSVKKSKAVSTNFSTPRNCRSSENIKKSLGNALKEVPLDDNKTLTVKGVTYVILKELGQGGSSVVFECYDPATKNTRAIKQVSLESKVSAIGYINEVKMLERLQNCPNIIKMYDYEVVEAKQQLLVVLEKGVTDLAKIIKRLVHQQLPLHKLMYYWMEMLHAVQQIHKQGIVHCDLKPSNFIMDQEGTIKLIDFGISCSIQNDMTSAVKHVAEGSLNYISPESVGSNASCNPESPSFGKPKYKINFKSDVWSLGCILYQLVYKRTPFSHIGHMYAKIAVILDPNHKIEYPEVERVPPKVINTIRKCLVHNSKSRPSISELIQEYENLIA